MKLNTRLMIAFLALSILPPLVTVIFAMFVAGSLENKVEAEYGYDAIAYEAIFTPEKYLSKVTDEVYGQLIADSINQVSKFEDENYLAEVDDKLSEINSYLVIEKYGKLKYCRENSEIVSILFGEDYFKGDFKSYIDKWNSGISAIYDNHIFMRKIELSYDDGTKGHCFIITNYGDKVPAFVEFFVTVLLFAMIFYIMVSMIVIKIVHSDFAKPINELKEAAKNVKEGFLEFELPSTTVKEMNELYADFDEMRLRLKKQAEEKMQYDKESKELISNISHDLKTPITAVKGYVEGIIDGVADTPERMDKYIRTIYNKANDMDRLINELTFYSKIDTNRIPYTFTKINVANYFSDCIEEKVLDLESKNIELAFFNYVSEDTLIIADTEQLKRVINNIIGNSIKYMDKEKGYINIRIKDVDDFIQVEIEDNGKGIGEKELPYIFDRFYRTDASRNSSTGGSGIGLSIVRKIIEDHGGKIWATSKESTGTVMYFTLRKYQEVPINE